MREPSPPPSRDETAEIANLRRSLRDLVALSMLPALWTGREPAHIAGSLAEALLSAIRADLVYVCLQGPAVAETIEAARADGQPEVAGRAREVGDALAPWLSADGSLDTLTAPHPTGSGRLRLVARPIGSEARWGRVVVGARRPDFPTELDGMLLSVGANQAAIALHTTSLTEQAREAAALQAREQAAAERIAELDRANQALLHTLETLADAPELQRFLGIVTAVITEQLEAHSSGLWLFDWEAGRLNLELVYQDGRAVPAAESGFPQPVITLSEAGKDPDWQTMLQERRAVVHDFTTNALFSSETRDYLTAHGVQRAVVVPLALGAEIVGILSVRLTDMDSVPPEKIALAHALAHQATLAIQMARLAAQARETAVLEERNRMAREIHDTLAQAFTGILLQVSTIERVQAQDPARAQARLTTIRDLAREGLAEARRSVQALRPQALEETDLAEALARMVQRLEPGMDPGRAPRLQFSLSGTPRALRPDVADHLLRIGQEGLTNALRHAEANLVRVELTFAKAEVKLVVQDDGRGFEVGSPEQREGFGLKGMRERASLLGAQMTVTSRPRMGTRVDFRWPGVAGNEGEDKVTGG